MDLPPPPALHIPLHSSQNSFPVIAIALIGILATAFLLLGYYIFVIKCCLNWHRIDVLNRLYSQRRTSATNFSSSDAAGVHFKGLEEAIIRSIPVIKFRKMVENRGDSTNQEETAVSYECAVCLSEFNDGERLRVIPNCCHAFHIDCIDVWLQSNANCPLCRSTITPSSVLLYNNDRIFAGNRDQNQNPDEFSGNDDDFVVIEIQGNNLDEPRLVRNGKREKRRKLEHVSSLGDEWIDIRKKDNEFGIMQPIRRSISMDLSVDREFCPGFQQCCKEAEVSEISSAATTGNYSRSSSKVRRSIFSFGNGKSSRDFIQPLHLES